MRSRALLLLAVPIAVTACGGSKHAAAWNDEQFCDEMVRRVDAGRKIPVDDDPFLVEYWNAAMTDHQLQWRKLYTSNGIYVSLNGQDCSPA